jgi:hypothetical protein
MTNALAYSAVVLITAEKDFYDLGLRKAFILSSWMDVWLTLLKVKLELSATDDILQHGHYCKIFF